MNSEDRRKARRARREAQREAKRKERNRDITLENMASMNTLYKAHKEARRGISWKNACQRYEIHWLTNIVRQHDGLMAGGEIGCRSRHIRIYERGKPREIDAPIYEDKVTQKALAQYALIPAIEPTLIEWNSANRKNKGILHALKHLRESMAKHYREHGSEGYILLMDYKSYFASIDHEIAKEVIRRNVEDKRIVRLASNLMDAQGEGLGLGSEPNQIVAVSLPNPIDHFITQNCGMKLYGRYMDDSWVIGESKAELEVILGLVRERCRDLKITLNEKKTRIVKLSHGFTICKKIVYYGENGKVVIKPNRDSIVRERKLIRGHARLITKGEMTKEDAAISYQSWRGWQSHFNAATAVAAMDAYYSKRIGSL